MWSRSLKQFLYLPTLCLILSLVITSLLFTGCGTPTESNTAKQKLDSMLGETPSLNTLPKDQRYQEKNSWTDNLLDHFLSQAPQTPSSKKGNVFRFGLPDIQIDETGAAYRVLVPLENPKDENSINVNVTPHRIQVQGKRSFGKDGFQGSSSFMKSFNTSQEVLPNQVSRSHNGNTLVITIPKKEAGLPHQSSQQKTLPKNPNNNQPEDSIQLDPELLRQLENTDQQFI